MLREYAKERFAKAIYDVVKPTLQDIVELVNRTLAQIQELSDEIVSARRRIQDLEDLVRETNLLRDREGKNYAQICPSCGKATSFNEGSGNCRRCGATIVKKTS